MDCGARRWAAAAAALGVLLLVCGFLARAGGAADRDARCPPSPWTWAPVALGFFTTLAGLLFLLRGAPAAESAAAESAAA